MNVKRQAGSLLVLLGLIGLGVTGAGAEPERPPALQRCREFCARVFDQHGNEFEECALACNDADVCHRDCKGKFGDDADKVHKCLRTCMRRTEKPPAVPPAEPVAPAEVPVKL